MYRSHKKTYKNNALLKCQSEQKAYESKHNILNDYEQT